MKVMERVIEKQKPSSVDEMQFGTRKGNSDANLVRPAGEVLGKKKELWMALDLDTEYPARLYFKTDGRRWMAH